jgi:hypothetical protein
MKNAIQRKEMRQIYPSSCPSLFFFHAAHKVLPEHGYPYIRPAKNPAIKGPNGLFLSFGFS